jgi:hypothetical protein
MRKLAFAAIRSSTFYAEAGRPLAASAGTCFAAQTASPIFEAYLTIHVYVS